MLILVFFAKLETWFSSELVDDLKKLVTLCGILAMLTPAKGGGGAGR